MVVSELRGEKIDIIPYNEEPARFVAKALSPARVHEVIVDDEERQATVIVPDDQLALAIGRDGQNARLAARLTGWRVDIKSETEFASEETGRRVRGRRRTFNSRCMAVLSTAVVARRGDRRLDLLRPARSARRFALRHQPGGGARRSVARPRSRSLPIRTPSRAMTRDRARAAANFVEEAEEVAAEESMVNEIVDDAIAEVEAEEAIRGSGRGRDRRGDSRRGGDRGRSGRGDVAA